MSIVMILPIFKTMRVMRSICLSEELLVDCDPYDAGCNGGDPSNAYYYLMMKNSGKVPTSASYPYSAAVRQNKTKFHI